MLGKSAGGRETGCPGKNRRGESVEAAEGDGGKGGEGGGGAGGEVGEGLFPGEGEPADVGLVAEPGHLAFGILAGAGDGAGKGFVFAEAAFEDVGGFGVADGVAGGGGESAGSGAEGAHFVEKAAGVHAAGAFGDAGAEDGAGKFEAEEQGARAVPGVGEGTAVGEEFVGAEEAPGVFGVADAVEGGRVEGADGVAEGGESAGIEEGLGAGAEGGGGGRVGGEAFGEAFDVEAGAAGDEDRAAAGGGGDGGGVAADGVEPRADGKGFGGGGEVEAEGGNGGAFGGGGFGGADVHAAVDGHGVGGEDGEGGRGAFGEGLGDGAFSRGGRAHEDAGAEGGMVGGWHGGGVAQEGAGDNVFFGAGLQGGRECATPIPFQGFSAMQRTMMKSKIHRATVTGCCLAYEGSVTIDPLLMRAADILPGEQVHVLDLENGERLVTYAIAGGEGSGTIQLNGAAARLVNPGDTVIIISYANVDESEAAGWQARVVKVDARNRWLEAGR